VLVEVMEFSCADSWSGCGGEDVSWACGYELPLD